MLIVPRSLTIGETITLLKRIAQLSVWSLLYGHPTFPKLAYHNTGKAFPACLNPLFSASTTHDLNFSAHAHNGATVAITWRECLHQRLDDSGVPGPQRRSVRRSGRRPGKCRFPRQLGWLLENHGDGFLTNYHPLRVARRFSRLSC